MGRKNDIRGYFKQKKNGEKTQEKTWTVLQRASVNRETHSLLIAAQNNAFRTNNIKAKADNTLQNNKCTLCSDNTKRFIT